MGNLGTRSSNDRETDPRHVGGGDTATAALKVIESLIHVGTHELEVKVLCGQLSHNRAALIKAANSAPFGLEIMNATEDMPSLMAWADIAVSGGGSTCWEMAFMGLPRWRSYWRKTSWTSSRSLTERASSLILAGGAITP